MRSASRADTFGHGTSDGLADGAVLFDERSGDADEARLGFVAVSDAAVDKNLGTTGNVRDAVGEQAASAGFSDRQRALLGGQRFNNHRFEPVVVVAENPFAQVLANDVL